MTIPSDLLATAIRYDKWRQVQALERSAAAEGGMKAARARFSGSRYLPIDDQVFFEEIVENDDLMPIRFFEMGTLAAKPVGRIHLDLGPKVGDGYATGFLVAPGVLLTNWHVLKTPALAMAATVSFDAQDDLRGLPLAAKVFRLRPQELFFSDEKLDFALVQVEPLASQGGRIEAHGYLRLFAQTGKILRDEYATIIQHPRGRQKQVAARNNKVVVYVYDTESTAPDNNYLYYKTDTLAGSSGSPVLSDQFFVVALHRRGVPPVRMVGGIPRVVRRDGTLAQPGDPASMFDYVANEGVRVSSILKRLRTLARHDAGAARAAQVLDDHSGVEADGPFWVPVAPPTVAPKVVDEQDGFLEIIRRKSAVFAGATGYDRRWLSCA